MEESRVSHVSSLKEIEEGIILLLSSFTLFLVSVCYLGRAESVLRLRGASLKAKLIY